MITVIDVTRSLVPAQEQMLDALWPVSRPSYTV